MEDLRMCLGLRDAAAGEDSDDEFFQLAYLSRVWKKTKRKHGGSAQGKCADRARTREQYGEQLIADYFADKPLYTPDEFRRRFRMRKSLFETVVAALVADESCNYFQQRLDATGLPGFLPEEKVTCALRMLAYASSADQMDELMRMAESTALETLKVFCCSIRRLYESEYL